MKSASRRWSQIHNHSLSLYPFPGLESKLFKLWITSVYAAYCAAYAGCSTPRSARKVRTTHLESASVLDHHLIRRRNLGRCDAGKSTCSRVVLRHSTLHSRCTRPLAGVPRTGIHGCKSPLSSAVQRPAASAFSSMRSRRPSLRTYASRAV